MLPFGRTAEVGRQKSKKGPRVDVERSTEFSKWLHVFLLVKVVSEEQSSNRL